jgi:hypothetical protein
MSQPLILKEYIMQNNRDYLLLDKSFIKSIDCYYGISFKIVKSIQNIANKSQLLEGIQFEYMYNKKVGILKDNIHKTIMVLSEIPIKLHSKASGLFSNTDFQSISLENIDTSECTSFEYMFYHNSTLVIDLGSTINSSHVESMHGMFENSYVREIINLNKLDTSQVKDMSSMFCGAEYLETLDIRTFNTESVLAAKSMFAGTKLKELHMEGLRFPNLDSVSCMFLACKIKDLYMEEVSLRNIKEANKTFMYAHIDNYIVS